MNDILVMTLLFFITMLTSIACVFLSFFMIRIIMKEWAGDD